MPIIVTNNFPPTRGGIQTMLGQLAAALHSIGSQVIIVAPDHSEAKDYDCRQPYRILRYRPLVRPLEIASIIATYAQAKSLSLDKQTLVSGWWPAGLAIALLPEKLRTPLWIISYGMEICPTRSGLRKIALLETYRRSSGAIAISGFTSDLLTQAGVRTGHIVIHPGIDRHATLPRKPQLHTIVSVGRLVARKGFDRTLEAVHLLAAEFPTLRYEIIGDGPDRARLEAIVTKLGIEERVHFFGKVSDTMLDEAYARAACFVLPVRRIGGDVEGFGLVYLEAARAGLASIGGRDSGALDAIVDGETGLLVDGESVDSIVAALRVLLTQPHTAAAMGQRGKERVERAFAWSDKARELQHYLADVRISD